MKRSLKELKTDYDRNKKILDKLKKEIRRLLKSSGTLSLFGSGNVEKVSRLINDNQEVIDEQKQLASELVMQGEDSGTYLKKNLFENVKNGDCAAIACSYIDGGDLETTDKDMWTPLHIAALNGHKSIAEFLLRIGSEVDSKTHLKQTPLHIAASHNKLGVAEILLKYGANPFAHTKNKQCAFYMSVSPEMKTLLKEYEATFMETNIKEPDKFLNACSSIFMCSIQHKNVKSLSILMDLQEKGVHVGVQQMDEQGNTPLHIVVMNDDEKSLDLILDKRPYPFKKNKNGQFPQQLATSKKVRAKMEAYEESFISEITGNPSAVKNMGNELLLYCIEKGYMKAVEDLLQFTNEGLIDINAHDENENTALHLATHYNREELVAILLRKGADMLVVNKVGKMPCDYVRDNKKLIRIYNNFERIWVNRVIQSFYSQQMALRNQAAQENPE